MSRAPIPGEVKTRLIPALGAGGAAALQARLLTGLVDRLIAGGIDALTLWIDGPLDHPALAPMTALPQVNVAPQPDGDLGARMQSILDAGLGNGEPAVLLGSDLPELEAATVLRALSVVRAEAPAAIAPTRDGGFCLLALARPVPGLFSGRDFSHAGVYQETLSRLIGHSGRADDVVILPEQWDVDEPEDLRRLAEIEGYGDLADGFPTVR